MKSYVQIFDVLNNRDGLFILQYYYKLSLLINQKLQFFQKYC